MIGIWNDEVLDGLAMSRNDPFDFWYAVSQTEVLMAPARRLETFGATVVEYHLLTEPMDEVGTTRVREGRLLASRPEIVAPGRFLESLLEGFAEPAAEAYARWLREHEADLLILRYGFRIRKEDVREELIHDPIEAVVERVQRELKRRDNPLAALVRGVDEPWEVCLVRLMVELVQKSGPAHARELRATPTGVRHEIEKAFRVAAADRSRLGELADLLRRERLFSEYEDRFFALVKSHQRRG